MHGHGFGVGQNEIIREFSNDIGAGIVMGGDQSTSYIGTELIEFLRPKNQSRPLADEMKPILDDAAYSFNRLIGDPSQSNNQIPGSSSGTSRRHEEP